MLECKCDCCGKITKESTINSKESKTYRSRFFEWELQEQGWLLNKEIYNKYYHFCSEKCYLKYLEKSKNKR